MWLFIRFDGLQTSAVESCKGTTSTPVRRLSRLLGAERYPNSFVKAEEASIRKAFLGVGLVLIKICSTSRTKLVQVHVEALRQ